MQRAAAAGVDTRRWIDDDRCPADLPPPRRPPAGDRAGGRRASATLGSPSIVAALDERLDVLLRAGGAAPTTATERCGPRSTGRTGCSMPTSSACSSGWRCSRAASSSTRRSTSSRAIGIDAGTATEHVESLVHKSMVTADAAPHGVRYRMLETMRAFALEQLDEQRRARRGARERMAEWVATITDLPVDDPCSAAVERNSIRLEREADNWRERSCSWPASARASWLAAAVRAAGRVLPPRPPRSRRRRAPAARRLRRRSDAPAGGAVRADRVRRRRHRPGAAARRGRTRCSDRRPSTDRPRRSDALAGTRVARRLRRRGRRLRRGRRVDERLRAGDAATCSSASPCSTISASPTPRADTHRAHRRGAGGRRAVGRGTAAGLVPARRRVGARRRRPRPGGAAGAPGARRHRRRPGADPSDPAGQRVAAAGPARPAGRRRGPARAARRRAVPSRRSST